jgi:hypothetical protein
MAANKQQGAYLTLFWAGATALCAGMAYMTEGFGKLVLIFGLAAVGISLFGFLKIKPLEGPAATLAGNTTMKLLGLALALGGWFVTVAGLHITQSNGGRLIFALAGIAVSLAGVLGVLPLAFGKNLIGKAEPTSYASIKTTMEHSR